MAVPRPVLIALLGLVLCAAAFLATRGAQDPGGSVTAAPTPAPAAEPAEAKQASEPKKAAAQPKDDTESKAERAIQRAEKDAGATGAGKAEAKPAVPAKPAAPKPAPKTADQTAIEVTRALGQGKAVVFFFTHHGAADDQQTRQAVKTLSGRKNVMIVQAGLEDLADYRPVLAGAGVSQVPSIVVVHADEPARLLEGYVDPGTLHQTVADALR